MQFYAVKLKLRQKVHWLLLYYLYSQRFEPNILGQTITYWMLNILIIFSTWYVISELSSLYQDYIPRKWIEVLLYSTYIIGCCGRENFICRQEYEWSARALSRTSVPNRGLQSVSFKYLKLWFSGIYIYVWMICVFFNCKNKLFIYQVTSQVSQCPPPPHVSLSMICLYDMYIVRIQYIRR